MKASPLRGQLVQGGLSLMTRGAGQAVLLEPYLYAKVSLHLEDLCIIHFLL